MLGKWDITSNVIDGEKQWQVYRLIDTGEVDHSGNREYDGMIFHDKDDAQEYADFLNYVGDATFEEVEIE